MTDSPAPKSLPALWFALCLAAACFAALAAPGQQPTAQPQTPVAEGGEIVANLAAGRAIVDVAKDGIVIGAVENPIEPNTRPPVIFPLSSERVAVLLGAVTWVRPADDAVVARMDRALAAIPPLIAAGGHPLNQAAASDFEQIGLAMLDTLRPAAALLEGELKIPRDEPLLELLIADYSTETDPDVWLLAYPFSQEEITDGFWQTRVGRPSFTQLWPPAKGAPHGLVEVDYPPGERQTPLTELLQQNDPRLAAVRGSDSKRVDAADALVREESRKVHVALEADFLPPALQAIAPPGGRVSAAVLGTEKGFAWLLRPPAAPEEMTKKKGEKGPPGAPSLRKPGDKP